MKGLLPRTTTSQACYDEFRWRIPAQFNIAEAVCDRHARDTPEATAVIYESDDGGDIRMSFGRLQSEANRFANVLAHLGIGRGDVVAIHLPQCLETVVAHVGIYKAGAITLPLFSLFGPDALRHRLSDSAARVLVTCADNPPHLETVKDGLDALEHIIVIDDAGAGMLDWRDLMAAASDRFATLDTPGEDPAMLIYTWGTTGNPKGALHPHRVLIGHMPGVEFPHGFFPREGDLFWTPADWAWAGRLLDVLLPGLFHGVPVLAKRFPKF